MDPLPFTREALREAFEIWVKGSGSFTDWTRERPDGPYLKPLVERTWQAWQAAALWAVGSDGDGQSTPEK